MNNSVLLLDVNGHATIIPLANIFTAMAAGDFKLYGMDLETIISLREEYMKKGGNMPITKESVKEVFQCA